jgi:hypothetical protein
MASSREATSGASVDPTEARNSNAGKLLANSRGRSPGRSLGKMGGLWDVNLASPGRPDEFASSIPSFARTDRLDEILL